MTSPRHAEATALGRYYTHPKTGAQLISVTNTLSVGCAKPALVPWAAKIATEAAWDALPRMAASLLTPTCGLAGKRGALPCGRCTDCLTREVKGAVTVARDKAADLGSRIHALAEAHSLGQTIAAEPGDDQAAPFLKQYERFLADFDIDLEQHVVATEMTVADPSRGYAGTLDLILELPLAGHLPHDKPGGAVVRGENGARGTWIVDIKTSTTRPPASVYGEYALQLAALRHATEAWMPDDTLAPIPAIHGAAVLNLRADKYELVPVPAGKAEYDAFLGCLRLAQWMHTTGADINRGDYRPVTPTGSLKPKATRTTRKAA